MTGLLADLLARRLLLVTGKGGTGKTSVAAALGWLAASEGTTAVVVELGTSDALPELLGAPVLADAEKRTREPQRARESMRQAVVEARVEEALWFQLSALTALCEGGRATAEDLASLRLVLGQLSEGLDTAPVAKARALLEVAGRA